MNWFDQIVLLITGLTAIYLIWCFYGRHSQKKGLYDLYYIPGLAVLFISGVLMIFLGYKILGLGRIALAFLTTGSQLLFFSTEVVLSILAPLLFLMTQAFSWGFVKDIKAS